MKNYIKSSLMAAIGILAVSCASEDEVLNNEVSNGKIQLLLNAEIDGYTSQDETRAEAQNVIRIMWNGSETVYAYDGSNYLGSLTAHTEDTDGTYAELCGTVIQPAGNIITLVYSPQFASEPAIEDGKIKLDLSRQDSEKVPFLIYGTVNKNDIVAPNEENKQLFDSKRVNFKLATSVAKINCTGLRDFHTTSVTSGMIEGVNTVCELTLSNTGAPTVAGSNPGVITRTAGITTYDNATRAIFSVGLPMSEATTARKVAIKKVGNLYESAFSTVALGVSKSYNSVLALTEYECKGDAPAYKNFDANWVRLWYGGPKFCTANMDAYPEMISNHFWTHEEYLGDYYAWSEDLVETTWNENWTLPSKEDFENLFAKCDYEWYGAEKNALKFTGKGLFADYTLILPVGGYKRNLDDGTYYPADGFYWTRDLHTNGTSPYFLYIKWVSMHAATYSVVADEDNIMGVYKCQVCPILK